METTHERPALPWPLTIAVLIVADVTATFETQMILAALKALYADLRDPVAVAWLVTTYLLISSVAAPILGRLGDLFGRKRVIVGAIATAAVGSALSAAHPDPDWIVAGRALQGVAGVVLLLAVWAWHELRHPDPLLDVRLLFRREMALTNLAIALVALGPFQLTLLMMLLLQQAPAAGIGLGLTAAAAGALKIPGNVCSVIVSPLAGQLCATIGERRVILFGFAANLASWLAMFLGYASFWPIIGVIVLSSIGTTVAFVGVANQVTRIAPLGRVSEALGVNVAVRSIAHACGSQVMTILLGTAVLTGTAGGGGDAKGAYLKAFAFIAAVCVAGLVTAMALPQRALAARD